MMAVEEGNNLIRDDGNSDDNAYDIIENCIDSIDDGSAFFIALCLAIGNYIVAYMISLKVGFILRFIIK
jgi:hypothetical protein